MKSVNFFNAQNHKKQQAMHRWFYATCIVTLTLLICLSIVSIRLYFTYTHLQKERIALKPMEERLSFCLTQKRELKEKTTQLKNQLAKTNRIKRKPKNPALLLRTLLNAADNVDLNTIQIDNKTIVLQLYASKVEGIMRYIENLRNEDLFLKIDLGTIEQADNKAKATIDMVTKYL